MIDPADEIEALLAKATQGRRKLEVEADPEDYIPAEVYICHPKTVCSATIVAIMGWLDHNDFDITDAAAIVALRNHVPTLIAELRAICATLATRDAQLAEAVEALRAITNVEDGEININNFDHDDVLRLNDASIRQFEIATATLACIEAGR